MDTMNFWALVIGAIAAIGIIEVGLVLAIYSIIRGIKELRAAHQGDAAIVGDHSPVTTR